MLLFARHVKGQRKWNKSGGGSPFLHSGINIAKAGAQ